jgi:7-keto-8-aminopelargonate synthetase-like enzyme
MCVWSARWLNGKGPRLRFVSVADMRRALGTIPALVSQSDVVLLDKLCHASLIDAAKLSGAHLRVFPHNNLRKLESHLDWAQREHISKRVLIVTESVFSMDPTVAKGSARLRITVTAAHEENQIRSLCEAIKRLSKIA